MINVVLEAPASEGGANNFKILKQFKVWHTFS